MATSPDRAKSLVNSGALPPSYLAGYSETLLLSPTRDVGVFGAVGHNGQLIVGHPGLDLVIVTKDAGESAWVFTPWELIKSALIEHDPVYAGDQVAFCAAYAAGDYAPDLIPVPSPSAVVLQLTALLSVIGLASAQRIRGSHGPRRSL